jgi:hypothetical protein
MSYYHWASEPVTLQEIRYPQSGQPKPNGLWFDVDEGWNRWCKATQFRMETLRYRHTVSILDKTRVLFLRNGKDIDTFTKTYGHNVASRIRFLQNHEDQDTFTRNYGHDLFREIQKQFSSYIMWEDVAEKYGGIIVAPYSRAKSETYLWYYGWNCAGGCIWDTSILRLGRPFKHP